MKAIQIKQVGGPEAMELVDLPVPEPKANEAVVKLAASGVNFIDVYNREGRYKVPLPFTLGQEGAGEVVSVGPGGRDEAGKLIPLDVKVGDRVLFGKWSGTEVKIDGVEYLIMKESDIMGVLADEVARKKAA